MIRTKKPGSRKTRDGGRESKAWRIWNTHNPDDSISPGMGQVIHHKDENPFNNDITNLQKMTDIEHKKYHTSGDRHPNRGKKFSKELRKKLSEAHQGQVPWNKGKTNIYSEETKKKMGSGGRGKPSPCGMLGKTHSEETKQKMRGRVPWNKGKKGVQTPWNKGLKKSDYYEKNKK